MKNKIIFFLLICTKAWSLDITLFDSNDNFMCMVYPNVKHNEFRIVRLADKKIIYKEDMDQISDFGDSLFWNKEKGYCTLYKDLSFGKIEIHSFKKFKVNSTVRNKVSFNEVKKYLSYLPYEKDNLPAYDIELFKFFGNQIFENIVAERSAQILVDGSDYRSKGIRKPIHPMGIGFTGTINFIPNKYSGVFKRPALPVMGRLSISQGNPSKSTVNDDGEISKQKRSTSLALKIFNTNNRNEKVVSANAVFQNDLNGEILENYTDGVMTNQPVLDVAKIKQSYEWFTLLGVVHGTLNSPSDKDNVGLGINPQFRPLHQLAESNENSPVEVKTPTWIKFQRAKNQKIVKADDFREEIYKTIDRYGALEYSIYSGEVVNKIVVWNEIGTLKIDQYYLSLGVDQNILFHHSSLRSEMTGEIINPQIVVSPIREK